MSHIQRYAQNFLKACSGFCTHMQLMLLNRFIFNIRNYWSLLKLLLRDICFPPTFRNVFHSLQPYKDSWEWPCNDIGHVPQHTITSHELVHIHSSSLLPNPRMNLLCSSLFLLSQGLWALQENLNKEKKALSSLFYSVSLATSSNALFSNGTYVGTAWVHSSGLLLFPFVADIPVKKNYLVSFSCLTRVNFRFISILLIPSLNAWTLLSLWDSCPYFYLLNSSFLCLNLIRRFWVIHENLL